MAFSVSSLQFTSIPSVKQLNAFLKSRFCSMVPLATCIIAVRIKTRIGGLLVSFLNIFLRVQSQFWFLWKAVDRISKFIFVFETFPLIQCVFTVRIKTCVWN